MNPRATASSELCRRDVPHGWSSAHSVPHRSFQAATRSRAASLSVAWAWAGLGSASAMDSAAMAQYANGLVTRLSPGSYQPAGRPGRPTAIDRAYAARRRMAALLRLCRGGLVPETPEDYMRAGRRGTTTRPGSGGSQACRRRSPGEPVAGDLAEVARGDEVLSVDRALQA